MERYWVKGKVREGQPFEVYWTDGKLTGDDYSLAMLEVYNQVYEAEVYGPIPSVCQGINHDHLTVGVCFAGLVNDILEEGYQVKTWIDGNEFDGWAGFEEYAEVPDGAIA